MQKMMLFAAIHIISSATLADWHDAGKVTRLHSGHGTGIWFFSTEKHAHVEGCDNSYGYNVSSTKDNSERQYSLLMAAYMAGEPVAVATTGECLEGRPQVNGVQIRETSYY